MYFLSIIKNDRDFQETPAGNSNGQKQVMMSLLNQGIKKFRDRRDSLKSLGVKQLSAEYMEKIKLANEGRYDILQGKKPVRSQKSSRGDTAGMKAQPGPKKKMDSMKQSVTGDYNPMYQSPEKSRILKDQFANVNETQEDTPNFTPAKVHHMLNTDQKVSRATAEGVIPGRPQYSLAQGQVQPVAIMQSASKQAPGNKLSSIDVGAKSTAKKSKTFNQRDGYPVSRTAGKP